VLGRFRVLQEWEYARSDFQLEACVAAQIDERFRQKLDALVKEAFDAYKESAQYEQDIEAAVDAVLRLDMAPNEYGLLQRRGILQVVGFDLIERHNRKFRPGTTILYYRDRPDFDPRDNLLNMLKYAVDHSVSN